MTHRHRLLALALAALALPLLGCTKTRRCSEIGLIENLDGICECAPPRVIAPGDRLRCDCPEGWDDVDGVCIPPDGGVDGGPVDDGCVPRTFYADADGDGRGDPAVSTEACVAPEGYVDNADDCDDTCAVCWSGAEEVCDAEDNDCNGHVDEGVRVPVGEPVLMTTGRGLSTLINNRITAEQLRDGGALVFYVDDSISGVTTDGVVTAQRLSPTGEPVGSPIQIDPGTVPHSHLASARNGDSIVVAYTQGASVRGRVFSAVDGAPTTPARELATQWASDIAITSYGTAFIFAWITDRNVVIQLRVRSLGESAEDVDVLASLSATQTLHPLVWVEDGGARTLVYRDGARLMQARFDGAVLPLPGTSPFPFAAADAQALGSRGGRLAVVDAIGEGFDGAARLSVVDLSGAVAEVVAEHPGALFGAPALTNRGDQIAVARTGVDLEIGAFLFTKGSREWSRSTITDVAPPTFGPLIISSLIIYSQRRAGDIDDLFVRRLGCEM